MPLAGLRVLEFSHGGVVPWGNRHLGQHGAEVIVVESWKAPSAFRLYTPPSKPGGAIEPDSSPWFQEWNAGKRHVGINLKHRLASELVAGLVGISDLVTYNLSPAAMDHLGLDYATLRRYNPSLIACYHSGYGLDGPARDYLAWGTQIETAAGFADLTGYPDAPPAFTPLAHPDWVGALHGLVAALSALAYQRQTGEGQWIDQSSLESSVASLGVPILEQAASDEPVGRRGAQSPAAAPHGCYPCRPEEGATEGWCVIAVTTDAQWRALRRALGSPSWSRDPCYDTLDGRLARRQEIDAHLSPWTSRRTAREVMERLQGAGVPAGVVQTTHQLLEDPQLKAREFFMEMEHAVKGTVTATGLAVRLCDPPAESRRAGASLGADHEYVFCELLGMSQEQVVSYTAQGVLDGPESFRAYLDGLEKRA